MDKDEISALKSGKCLNTRIAEEVMGHRVIMDEQETSIWEEPQSCLLRLDEKSIRSCTGREGEPCQVLRVGSKKKKRRGFAF